MKMVVGTFRAEDMNPIEAACGMLGAYIWYSSQAASSLQQLNKPLAYSANGEDEHANVDWDNLGFGFMPTDYMYTMKCSKDGSFEQGQLMKGVALANKRWEGLAPLNLYIEEEFHRASRGGAGGVKSITNYAPVLKAIARAKAEDFLMYCNVISTPAANGTILQGVTRRSVIEIAGDHGYQVEERAISVDELMDADEVFCTGTAVGVAPVGQYHISG
ncbi:hypothetical protein GH714_010439 [Hevea brasiliensis]|uniref:Branched-chain-amino-acid aminotransferase n=1 Tax=Hevea brasiliensis TaxID=3981 RepID=A0A6A6NGE8_HEVBR|nr:hypothetical protein GH714_010439 [Hevea brasiliensis]